MTRRRLDDARERALDAISVELLSARVHPRFARLCFPEGHAPLALANAVLDRVRPGVGHAARADHHLARAAAALSGSAAEPSLIGGFSGVAWAIEHLRGGAGDGVDRTAAVERALASYIDVDVWNEPYDLFSGLVGYGVYFLERLPRASARASLARIVDHLEARALTFADGITWESRPEWIAEQARGPHEEGFNLGVAHGVPGVVALLAKLVEARVEVARASRLLEGAVAWLLAQESPCGELSAFGYSVRPGVPFAPSRAAYCYGDAGVALAIAAAARASGERAWKRAAIRIGERAADRDESTTGVEDAGLCHGAAGLAQIFGRLHQLTGGARFASAADHWMQRTLAMRLARGGYRSKSLTLTSKSPELVWRRDGGFLTGTAGIDMAIATHALANARESGDWDRVLLLS